MSEGYPTPGGDSMAALAWYTGMSEGYPTPGGDSMAALAWGCSHIDMPVWSSTAHNPGLTQYSRLVSRTAWLE
jgi:formiminotetrahydrofolate cyclodeaminase